VISIGFDWLRRTEREVGVAGVLAMHASSMRRNRPILETAPWSIASLATGLPDGWPGPGYLATHPDIGARRAHGSRVLPVCHPVRDDRHRVLDRTDRGNVPRRGLRLPRLALRSLPRSRMSSGTSSLSAATTGSLGAARGGCDPRIPSHQSHVRRTSSTRPRPRTAGPTGRPSTVQTPRRR
jgi:hypothetical protein